MRIERAPNIFEMLIFSINIMEVQIASTNFQTYLPELLIQSDLGHIKFLEINRAEETIIEEYKEAKAQLDHIPGEGGFFSVF